jgi:hypothetical protein
MEALWSVSAASREGIFFEIFRHFLSGYGDISARDIPGNVGDFLARAYLERYPSLMGWLWTLGGIYRDMSGRVI